MSHNAQVSKHVRNKSANETQLKLTRRVGEAIKLGNDITVTVSLIKGNQVQLMFHAPKNVKIYREEVYERIQQEGRLSA